MLRRSMVLSACLLVAMSAPAATTLKLVEVITSPERTETLKGSSRIREPNPGVHVEITSLPWGPSFEKFATMVAAGDTPDVVEMPDRWLSLYANNGTLESLEPYLAKWNETATLERTHAADGARRPQHRLHAALRLLSARALSTTRSCSPQAGVAAPPRTLDEFAAVSKKISRLPGKYGYCLRGGAGGVNGWMMFGAPWRQRMCSFRPTAPRPSPTRWVKGFSLLADTYTRRDLRPRTASTGATTTSSPAFIPAPAR